MWFDAPLRGARVYTGSRTRGRRTIKWDLKIGCIAGGSACTSFLVNIYFTINHLFVGVKMMTMVLIRK